MYFLFEYLKYTFSDKNSNLKCLGVTVSSKELPCYTVLGPSSGLITKVLVNIAPICGNMGQRRTIQENFKYVSDYLK